jgi:hypothetical protein
MQRTGGAEAIDDVEAEAEADVDAADPSLAVTRGCGVTVEHPRGWAVRVEAVPPAAAAAAAAAAPPGAGTLPSDEAAAAAAVGAAAQRAGMLLHNVPTGATLRLRTRRDGDRFAPHWRSQARPACSVTALTRPSCAHAPLPPARAAAQPIKLTAFLREARVPLHARDALPLLLLRGAVAAVYPAWAAAPLHAPGAQAGPVAAAPTVSVRLVVQPRG